MPNSRPPPSPPQGVVTEPPLLLAGKGDTVFDLDAASFSSDDFRMYSFKIKRCPRARPHDWTQCPFAHPGEKARRRDPRRFRYSGTACPDFRRSGCCRRSDACPFSHGVFECWMHPSRYRSQMCTDGASCKRRVCFFAHSDAELRKPEEDWAWVSRQLQAETGEDAALQQQLAALKIATGQDMTGLTQPAAASVAAAASAAVPSSAPLSPTLPVGTSGDDKLQTLLQQAGASGPGAGNVALMALLGGLLQQQQQQQQLVQAQHAALQAQSAEATRVQAQVQAQQGGLTQLMQQFMTPAGGTVTGAGVVLPQLAELPPLPTLSSAPTPHTLAAAADVQSPLSSATVPPTAGMSSDQAALREQLADLESLLGGLESSGASLEMQAKLQQQLRVQQVDLQKRLAKLVEIESSPPQPPAASPAATSSLAPQQSSQQVLDVLASLLSVQQLPGALQSSEAASTAAALALALQQLGLVVPAASQVQASKPSTPSALSPELLSPAARSPSGQPASPIKGAISLSNAPVSQPVTALSPASPRHDAKHKTAAASSSPFSTAAGNDVNEIGGMPTREVMAALVQQMKLQPALSRGADVQSADSFASGSSASSGGGGTVGGEAGGASSEGSPNVKQKRKATAARAHQVSNLAPTPANSLSSRASSYTLESLQSMLKQMSMSSVGSGPLPPVPATPMPSATVLGTRPVFAARASPLRSNLPRALSTQGQLLPMASGGSFTGMPRAPAPSADLDGLLLAQSQSPLSAPRLPRPPSPTAEVLAQVEAELASTSSDDMADEGAANGHTEGGTQINARLLLEQRSGSLADEMPAAPAPSAIHLEHMPSLSSITQASLSCNSNDASSSCHLMFEQASGSLGDIPATPTPSFNVPRGMPPAAAAAMVGAPAQKPTPSIRAAAHAAAATLPSPRSYSNPDSPQPYSRGASMNGTAAEGVEDGSSSQLPSPHAIAAALVASGQPTRSDTATIQVLHSTVRRSDSGSSSSLSFQVPAPVVASNDALLPWPAGVPAHADSMSRSDTVMPQLLHARVGSTTSSSTNGASRAAALDELAADTSAAADTDSGDVQQRASSPQPRGGLGRSCSSVDSTDGTAEVRLNIGGAAEAMFRLHQAEAQEGRGAFVGLDPEGKPGRSKDSFNTMDSGDLPDGMEASFGSSCTETQRRTTGGGGSATVNMAAVISALASSAAVDARGAATTAVQNEASKSVTSLVMDGSEEEEYVVIEPDLHGRDATVATITAAAAAAAEGSSAEPPSDLMALAAGDEAAGKALLSLWAEMSGQQDTLANAQALLRTLSAHTGAIVDAQSLAQSVMDDDDMNRSTSFDKILAELPRSLSQIDALVLSKSFTSGNPPSPRALGRPATVAENTTD